MNCHFLSATLALGLILGSVAGNAGPPPQDQIPVTIVIPNNSVWYMFSARHVGDQFECEHPIDLSPIVPLAKGFPHRRFAIMCGNDRKSVMAWSYPNLRALTDYARRVANQETQEQQ